MRADLARRLKAHGWQVGDSTEFLALTEQDAALVDLRLALGRSMREGRREIRHALAE